MTELNSAIRKPQVLLLATLLLPVSGCTLLKPKPAAPVLTMTEPDLGGEYLLYKPTFYDDGQVWPLVVLCHDSPFADPKSIIADWAELAEDKGLILLAPELSSNKGWPPKQEEQLKLQERDEQRILAMVQHVRGSCRIADDRVFIGGVQSGCRSAMHVGLRHPEVFRLVALLKPDFQREHFETTLPFLDPYQRVLVVLPMGRFGTEQPKACRDWLREQSMAVVEVNRAAGSAKHPDVAYRFFKKSIMKHPWIRIEAYQTRSPTRVRFQAVASIKEIYKYEWDFGDGESDVVAGPEHEYARPGVYQVTLKIYSSDREAHSRKIRITVPAGYRPDPGPSAQVQP